MTEKIDDLGNLISELDGVFLNASDAYVRDLAKRASAALSMQSALLKEAAERILAIRHKSDCSCADCVTADGLRARIRAHLEAGQ